MRTLSSLLLLALPLTLTAQEKSPAEASAPAAAAPAKTPQEELEQKFIDTLTNATFTGRWCMIREGKLTPEKEDKYSILGVTKGKNGAWTINARITYGLIDVTVPVPVKVEWAGGAPVIIVDKLGIPGGSSYSARVVVYEDTYAGTWSGGDIRGLLNGMITREEKKETEAAPPAKE